MCVGLLSVRCTLTEQEQQYVSVHSHHVTVQMVQEHSLMRSRLLSTTTQPHHKLTAIGMCMYTHTHACHPNTDHPTYQEYTMSGSDHLEPGGHQQRQQHKLRQYQLANAHHHIDNTYRIHSTAVASLCYTQSSLQQSSCKLFLDRKLRDAACLSVSVCAL